MTNDHDGESGGGKVPRRKGWVAALLSLLLPGLGQLYNGQLRKAVVYYLAATVAGLFLFAAVYRPQPLLLMVSVLVVQLFIELAAIIDAARAARRIGVHFRPAAYNRSSVYLGTYLVLGLLIAHLISDALREHVVQAFNMPSASMEPSLLVGDHILVDKAAATFSRGDIVVFEFPEDAHKDNPRDFIKRIAGMPGDEIEIRNKQLFVNGQQVVEPYAMHLEAQTMPAAASPRDFFGPLVVPEGTYFVLGDNRDRSYDSRFWGVVERHKIRGRAVQLYWSWDRENGAVRWGRIGMETPSVRGGGSW